MKRVTRLSLRSKNHRRLALLLAGSLVAAACGGSGGGGAEPAGGGDGGDGGGGGTAAEEDVGPPQSGGRVAYGVEAATTGGWCLPAAQLAISGIQVARSMYDTLTIPDSEGQPQPFLAESVESNQDATVWTITLRDGITFHDGSELTAEVVKNNLDAYRGQNPDIPSTLFLFVFQDIESVEVTGPLEVTVSMKRPWAAFDSFLYASGRLGMVAQAQLNDPATCDRNLIGTGPFMLPNPGSQSLNQLNDSMTLVRNENYWRTDENGEALPYLDEIEYRAIPPVDQRVNDLLAGGLDAFHTSDHATIAEMRSQAEDGIVSMTDSADFAEVSHLMLNAGREPFDNPIARKAAAFAINNERINEVVNRNVPEIANSPFAPGSIGFLEDNGNPVQPSPGVSNPDPEQARELVQQYEEETGQPLRFEIASPPEPEVLQIRRLVQEDLEAVGIEVNTTNFEQSQFINEAISGNFQMFLWRNYPGFDPDTLFVWWHSGGEQPGEGDPDGDGTVANPVNFPNINDPEIDRLLDQGRTTTDPEERQQIYQDLNREFSDEAYLLWGWWTVWGVPAATDVRGVVGARPVDAEGVSTDGSDDYTGLAVGHDPALLWREQ